MPLLHLSKLPPQQAAVVIHVLDFSHQDPISTRLRNIGFLEGEPIRLMAKGPFGGTPLLIAIGHTQFALRPSEAERVIIRTDAHHD
jgi:ferrous iron transport protein A